MASQPENMPADFEAAFQYLGGVSAPSVNDFKLMAYVETGGEAFYAGIANGTSNQKIKDLLNKNGREERAHAHRGWLRQNGKEEINHSERVKEALGYL